MRARKVSISEGSGRDAAFFVFGYNPNEMDGEENTTLRMGYTRIETKRAGRRACAKARATTGTALVKHYALCYAFPKN